MLLESGVHLMLDIETLGIRPDAEIISIGACTFDNHNILSTFYRTINIGDGKLPYSGTTDPSTIKWWADQGGLIINNDPFDTLPQVLQSFIDYVKLLKAQFVWAKDPAFDCVIMESAFRRCELTWPFGYSARRCVRTITKLAKVESVKIDSAHNALEDAKNQVNDVIAAHRKLQFSNPGMIPHVIMPPLDTDIILPLELEQINEY